MRRRLRRLLLLALVVQLALLPSASAQEEPEEQAEACRPPIVEVQPVPDRFEPGDPYHLRFLIENPNRQPVETVFATVTTTAPGGWTATVAQRELTLAPREFSMESLTVTAPPQGTGEPAGNLTIHVTFVCTSGDIQTSASSSVTVEVRAREFRAPWPIVLAGFLILATGVGILGVRRLRRGVALTCDAPERLVAPGKSAKFDLHVQNRRGRPQRLMVIATGVPEGWQVHVALDEVSLEPGEEKTLWALVKAPPQAEPGDEASVTIRLQNRANGRDGAATVVKARVTAGA